MQMNSVQASLVALTLWMATEAVADRNGVIARFTTTGALDPTFNRSGWVTSPNPLDDYVTDVVIAGTQVVTCGFIRNANGTSSILVGRFNEDGTVDRTFGFAGVTALSRQGSLGPPVCMLDARSNILVAADDTDANSYTTNTYLVVRFTSSGALDPAFGNGGVAPISGYLTSVRDISQPIAYARALELDGSSRPIVVGHQHEPFPP